jgi:FkbM family methyltransferase
MTDFLAELLRPERLTAIVDVGAYPIDSTPPYQAMLERRLCRVIGFEPQPEALAALAARKSDLETYLPYVVGDGNSATLRVCRAPGMTSLLAPDPTALRHFPGFPEWGQVIRETAVATQRLDDIAEIDVVDFIKIDVQGSELDVLRNGRERLKDVVAVQTEVSFINLYQGQPAFGEIDAELRAAGFVPHTFVALRKRMIAPLAGNSPFAGLNQLLEADMVYVRDFMRPERMTAEQLKHLALVAHHCYGSIDLSTNCLHHLVRSGAVPSDAMNHYLAAIKRSTQVSPGVTSGNA